MGVIKKVRKFKAALERSQEMNLAPPLMSTIGRKHGLAGNMLLKEEEWQSTFERCRPYIKDWSVGIDVGARIGEFAYYMKDFDRVHSFEFRQGLKTQYMNRCKPNQKYTYTKIGISDHNGFEYTSSQRVGRIKGEGNLKIKTRTIDSYNFKNVGFIKLDVEGHEYKCVVGAENTIKKYYPVMLVEQNKGNFSASDLLIKWGYEVVDKMHLGGMLHDYIMLKK